jgi:hypothetical protein
MHWPMIILILVLIPQIASGECAWIHWEKLYGRPTPTSQMCEYDWQPRNAFTAMNDCIQDMYKAYAIAKRWGQVTPESPTLMGNAMNYELQLTTLYYRARMECWPSEIKPLESKPPLSLPPCPTPLR